MEDQLHINWKIIYQILHEGSWTGNITHFYHTVSQMSKRSRYLYHMKTSSRPLRLVYALSIMSLLARRLGTFSAILEHRTWSGEQIHHQGSIMFAYKSWVLSEWWLSLFDKWSVLHKEFVLKEKQWLACTGVGHVIVADFESSLQFWAKCSWFILCDNALAHRAMILKSFLANFVWLFTWSCGSSLFVRLHKIKIGLSVRNF
jgi:hypothetical protein